MSLEEIIQKAVDDAVQLGLNARKVEYDTLKASHDKLVEAIRNVPTDEYGEAQRDGCDSCGAWDCFLEKLVEWEERTLKEAGEL